MSIERKLAQAGRPDRAPPGGTAWRILCLWQQFEMAEIPGEHHCIGESNDSECCSIPLHEGTFLGFRKSIRRASAYRDVSRGVIFAGMGQGCS